MRALNVIPIVAVLMATLSSPLLAHENLEPGASWPRAKVSIDGTFALFGALLSKAEFKINDQLSALVHLGYVDNRMSVNPNIHKPPTPWVSGRIGAGARFYVLGTNMSGFFIDGSIEMDLIGLLSGVEENLPGLGRVSPIVWILKNSGYIGYSWVSHVGFFADITAGLEIEGVVTGAPDYVYSLADGIHPHLHMNLGWAF